MSEIFEALRKAQREADQRRTKPTGAAADEPRVESTPFQRVEQLRPTPPARPARPAAGRPRAPRQVRWLPRWMRGSQNGSGPVPAEAVISPKVGTAVNEQFRLLRTRIETVGPGTFMITSALDQEGKTLCATNLAAVLSLSLGAGVLLVDADLRHPSVGRWLRLDVKRGLVDCLLGEADWSDCLLSTEHQRLRVLPAGRGSSMSTELLGSERMLTILSEMKQKFPAHYILVDAPPLLLTADPLVLARHVDHVLLIVRAGITPRSAVMKAIETLGATRFLGIVFNGATENVSQYYYYGRYPYGDGAQSRD